MESVRCPVWGCHGVDGAPRELTGEPLCSPCRSRAERALAELPRIYVGLRTTDEPGAAGERVGGGDAVREPINLFHRVLATRIHDALVSYEDTCRAMRGLTLRPRRVREAWAVDKAVRLLQVHGDVLWVHPVHGPELATRLLRLKLRGWSALKWGSSRIELDLPCPYCELRALCRHHGGADFVRCRNCGSWWDEEGYHRLVAILLAEQTRVTPKGAKP